MNQTNKNWILLCETVSIETSPSFHFQGKSKGNHILPMRRYSPGTSQAKHEVPVCTKFEKCKGCPYPTHGFVCWGNEESCLRTAFKKIIEKEDHRHAESSSE